MTYEEARNMIDEMRAEIKAKHMCRSMDGKCTSEEVAEYRCRFAALSMAIEALEKQIPKKPDDTYEDSLDDECAVCGTFIFERDKYCPRCGQALDWGE